MVVVQDKVTRDDSNTHMDPDAVIFHVPPSCQHLGGTYTTPTSQHHDDLQVSGDATAVGAVMNHVLIHSAVVL